MEKDLLTKLKFSLDEIKIKHNEYLRAKNKKDKESIDRLLTILKNNLISNYDLMKYDLYVKSESHNTNYFIHDVDSIILKLEEDKNN